MAKKPEQTERTSRQCQKCGEHTTGKEPHICARPACSVCGKREMWCQCNDKRLRFSSTCVATDDTGRILTLTPINTLCPIEHFDAACKIAYDFITQVEKSAVTLDQMFTTLLRPVGEVEATHLWCPRLGYDNQVEMQITRMAEVKQQQNLGWMTDRVYTLNDKRKELLSKFVLLTEDADEILAAFRLEIVP